MCPNCGYCRCCGRSHGWPQVAPVWPRPWYWTPTHFVPTPTITVGSAVSQAKAVLSSR
jgi:hypothetical protein